MTEDRFSVVVIGAGLAGLSAAAHLAARGLPPLVLEADRLWPGGRLSGGAPDTFEYDGRAWSFSSESGMHALWGGYVNMRAMLRRFTDTALQESPGEEWINRWRREVRAVESGRLVRFGWLPAPFHYLSLLLDPRFYRAITPLDFLSLPGFLFSMLWAVGFDPLREQRPLDGLTMDDFFRLWTPNLKATFTGVGINLLAAPPETISLTAFIAAMRFYTILRRDAWQMHYFPANAHDALIAPLIRHIEDHEGLLMTGVTAQRLERIEGGWRVVVDDVRRGGTRALLAENVILAVQAPAAQRLLTVGDTAARARCIRFPGAVQNATVHLWFDASPRPGTPGGMFTGDFLPDNFFWLHRLYPDFRAWHEATGGSAIELHLYANDTVHRQPDQVIIVRCVDEVQRAFPELRGHFVHGARRLNTLDHTLFRVPAADSLWVETPWPNLFACGDWVGYDTPAFWMERATVTGMAAANHVLAANSLPTWDIQPPPPPEALARALGAAVRLFRRSIGRAALAAARTVRRRA
jgi:isorenieratene synthase